MNKIRTALLILMLLLLLSLTVACGNSPETPPVGDDGGGDGGEVTLTPIYQSGVAATLVYDGVQSRWVNALAAHLSEKTGRTTELISSATPSSGGEIVVGETDRPISKRAYRLLERMDKSYTEEVRYLVYSDGESVAIAFDPEVYGIAAAEEDAITLFINEYCGGESLEMKKGTHEKELYSVIERQRKQDEAGQQKAWAEAEEKLSELYGAVAASSIISSMKDLYKLYSGGMISWLANLYDVETGGFYYSNSARNNEGFLPDLESTYQALALLESTGVMREVGGAVRFGLPEWMQKDIVAFTKSLQDKNSGYFYHPQWSRILVDSLPQRRGRDLTNAVNILAKFEALPTYDTPSGVKGDGILADGSAAPAAFYLAAPLGSSRVEAVSRVISASDPDAYVTPHLRTKEAFVEYLNGLKLNESCYSVGNLLESQANQIVARDKVLEQRGEDYRLADILADWFTRHQNPRTGTWYLTDVIDYEAVNGILKISSTYHRINKPFPNADLAIRAAMICMMDTAPIRHVCDIINTWYAITVIRNNLVAHTGDDAAYRAVLSEMIENFPTAVTVTMEKLAVLRRDDGSFGYLPNSSAPDAQGCPAAVPGTYEGDVNAAYLASGGVLGHIYTALGITDCRVAIFTEADRLRFVSTVEELGAIVKDIPFDDRDSANGVYVRKNGGVYYPEEGSTYNLETVYRYTTEVRHDSDITKETHEYIQIVSDDDKLSGVLEYGKASLESYYGVCFGRTGGHTAGNCFVFETDIKINKITDEVLDKLLSGGLPVFVDLQLAKTTSITAANVSTNVFYDKVGGVYIERTDEGYSSSFSHPMANWQYKASGAMGKSFGQSSWYTVAFELYDNGIAKYYVNNNYVGEARVLADPTVFYEIDTVRVALNQSAVLCNIQLDNTYVGNVSKEFVEGEQISYDSFVFEAGEYYENLGGLDYETAIVKSLENSGYLVRSTYNTKDNMEGKTHDEILVEYIRIAEGALTERVGRVLEFTTLKRNAKGFYLRETATGTYGNCFVFETDLSLTVDGESARGMLASGQNYFASLHVASAKAASSVTGSDPNTSYFELARIYIREGADGKLRYYLNHPYAKTDKVATEETEITSGWHRFTAEVYRDEGVVKYYLDGVFVSEYTLAADAISANYESFNAVKLSFRDPIDDSTVWLDDSFLGRVQKVYVQPPKPDEPDRPDPEPTPSEGGGSLGADNAPEYDGDGWIY